LNPPVKLAPDILRELSVFDTELAVSSIPAVLSYIRNDSCRSLMVLEPFDRRSVCHHSRRLTITFFIHSLPCRIFDWRFLRLLNTTPRKSLSRQRRVHHGSPKGLIGPQILYNGGRFCRNIFFPTLAQGPYVSFQASEVTRRYLWVRFVDLQDGLFLPCKGARVMCRRGLQVDDAHVDISRYGNLDVCMMKD
jgi:hypothetical protein